MEELELDLEMQRWHPDRCMNIELIHFYLRNKSQHVVFMSTIKIENGDARVLNSYVTERYSIMRDQLLGWSLKQINK